MFHQKVRISFLLLMVCACLLALAVSGSTEVYGKPRAKSRAKSRAKPQAKPLSRNRVQALHPQARVRLNAALREMRARGIRPRVNSTFRSRAEQQAIYRCASIRPCRLRRGIYGANPPGTSLHEAGLAVDIGGIATGRRHKRRLTPKGRQIVRIMRKHGFVWRYGLGDPAHFEASPRLAGYRTERAAIQAAQQRWLLKNRRVRRAARTGIA
jgi:LAS superfamily LD-carboxypeptidase LdcB